MRKLLRMVGLVVWLSLPATRGAAEAVAPAGSQSPHAEQAVPPWWVAGELHLSVLSNLVDQSTINLAFGYALRASYRWKTDWGAYFQVEHDMWAETEIETQVRQGVLNLGVGGERLFFQRRMRAALGVGPSILLYETALDDPGTTGLYIDARPTGIRWPVGKRPFVLVLDPLTFTVEMPALSGIPLVQIQYRTLIGLEYGLGR
jgi:hypothetical protein